YSAQPNVSINWATVPAAFNLPATDSRGVYPASVATTFNLNYTRRKSLSLNLDYRLSPNTTLFLNNQVNTSYIRAWGRGTTLNLAAPSATATAASTNVTLPGYS